jgi:hypothetical protein
MDPDGPGQDAQPEGEQPLPYGEGCVHFTTSSLSNYVFSNQMFVSVPVVVGVSASSTTP